MRYISMTEGRIKTADGSHIFQGKKKELLTAVDAVNEMLKLSDNITSADMATHGLDELNGWIRMRTQFPNAEEAVKLLDKGKEYARFITLYHENKDSFYPIQIVDGVASITEERLEEIRISCNSYMDEEDEKLYREVRAKIDDINEFQEKKFPGFFNIIHVGPSETLHIRRFMAMRNFAKVQTVFKDV